MGRAIALAPFLTCLTPCPMTLALDLMALDREEAETADWSDEREDLAEDLAADFVVEEGGISWPTKKKGNSADL